MPEVPEAYVQTQAPELLQEVLQPQGDRPQGGRGAHRCHPVQEVPEAQIQGIMITVNEDIYFFKFIYISFELSIHSLLNPDHLQIWLFPM